MTPSAWIALASLACVLLVHAVGVAFVLGRTIQRVATLEKSGDGMAVMTADMAEMKSDVRHMAKSIDELKGKLAWATEVAPNGPGRGR